MYKNNSGLIAKTKVSKFKKGLCLTENLVRDVGLESFLINICIICKNTSYGNEYWT